MNGVCRFADDFSFSVYNHNDIVIIVSLVSKQTTVHQKFKLKIMHSFKPASICTIMLNI